MKFLSSRAGFLSLFLLLLPFTVYPQIDSTYIEPYPQKFSLRLYASNNSTSLLHNTLYGKNTYEPNKPPGLGAGFSLGRVGLSLSYGFGFLTDKQKGETRSLDLQYHYYGRKLVYDLMGQLYKGFYKDNVQNENTYEVHTDLAIIRLGFFGQYVFNSSKFSYRAGFNLKDKQLKSAGSFLLGGGIYYNEIHSSIQNFFNDSSEIKQINFQIGPSAGYAYTWAISQHCFISLSLSAGFNLGFTNDRQNFMIYPTAIPRFAAGYNAESWSLSLSYINNIVYTYYTKEQKAALSSPGLQLNFTRRFYWYPKFVEKYKKNKLVNYFL